MPADLESRLRAALRARAGDVEPDPHAWERVQARLARSRRRTWALAGAGAAAAAAVIAVAAVSPALFGTRVEFDPPVADRPAATPSDAPTPHATPTPSPLPPQPGLPAAVEEGRQEIAAAAAAGDVAALRARMVEEFAFSFGADPGAEAAAAHLRSHPEVVARVPDLLAAPHATVGTGDDLLYVWPRAHAIEPGQWTDEDVAVLRDLGFEDGEIEAWRAGEGYLGPRLGIDADGAWRFLVAGD